ncbi:MAG TPA: hypothetical protein DEH02_03390 [Bacteroidales bacterium]|nr:MAG: hypothetical protein A2X01_19970 [Bacteroidetes bacterium GWF2_35_48]HBX50094.1 hypothetical protein [Bacteroidales bacterium]
MFLISNPVAASPITIVKCVFFLVSVLFFYSQISFANFVESFFFRIFFFSYILYPFIHNRFNNIVIFIQR